MSSTTFDLIERQPKSRTPRQRAAVALVVAFFVLFGLKTVIFIEGLWDDVGIVKRLTMAPDAIAEWQADRAMLVYVHWFHQVYDLNGIHYDYTVGCPIASMGAADKIRWVAYAQHHGWGPYPSAGELCVDP